LLGEANAAVTHRILALVHAFVRLIIDAL